MTLARRLSVLATTLFLFVSALSCQSGTPETPHKSAVPSPEKNLPTPSDELPEMPAIAAKETKQGALAFGRYYYNLINYGRATGDWKPAKDVTASSCQPCRDFWAAPPNRMGNDFSIRLNSAPYVARFDESRKIVVFSISSDRNIKDNSRRPRNAWADGLSLEYEDGSWQVVHIDINDLSKSE